MADEPTLLISGSSRRKFRAHGAETYPHECCGALLGRDAGEVAGTIRKVCRLRQKREILALYPLVNRETIRRVIAFLSLPRRMPRPQQRTAAFVRIRLRPMRADFLRELPADQKCRSSAMSTLLPKSVRSNTSPPNPRKRSRSQLSFSLEGTRQSQSSRVAPPPRSG